MRLIAKPAVFIITRVLVASSAAQAQQTIMANLENIGGGLQSLCREIADILLQDNK